MQTMKMQWNETVKVFQDTKVEIKSLKKCKMKMKNLRCKQKPHQQIIRYERKNFRI